MKTEEYFKLQQTEFQNANIESSSKKQAFFIFTTWKDFETRFISHEK